MELPVGVGGVTAGGISWLGPDYTCPNYLSNEEVRLMIDGEQRLLTMNIYRARKTGVFYGVTNIGDLEICLLDYAPRGEPWTARQVIIKNKSATVAHKVNVQAYVTPATGAGRSASIAADSSGCDSGVSLKLDTSLKCVVNWVCQNWANRYALITFNEPTTTATSSGGSYFLDTGTKNIAAGGCYNVALCHYMHYDDKADSDYISLVRKRKVVKDAESCIRQWQKWFDDVSRNTP